MDEFKRILVPLDGSELAERALLPATTLARQFDSQIILIRVLDFHDPRIAVSPPEVVRNTALMELYDEAGYEAKQYLQSQEDKLHRQAIKVRSLFMSASPAETIIETAKEEKVDLIVMSTHGRGGLARWAFGSVADKVIRHSFCPVLLVRQQSKARKEVSS